jgi:hypothetical protein
LGARAGLRVTGTNTTLAFVGRRSRRMNRPQRELRGTQRTARQPKVPERERQANRPGRTKAVVATHSTAGQGTAIDPARKRGEPRPKGPTIKAARLREGNAGHDVCAKERQRDLEPDNCLNGTGADCHKVQAQKYAPGWAAIVMRL